MIERLPDQEAQFPGIHYPCRDSDHEVPSHMVFQPGRYRHTCRGCGRIVEFSVNGPTL